MKLKVFLGLLLITVGIFVWKGSYVIGSGYMVSGLGWIRGIKIVNKEALDYFRKEVLSDDERRLVWWNIRYSNNIVNKNLETWSVKNNGIVTGCGKDEMILGGKVRKITVQINPNLINRENIEDVNRIFVKCSLLNNTEDVKFEKSGIMLSLFNKDGGIFSLK